MRIDVIDPIAEPDPVLEEVAALIATVLPHGVVIERFRDCDGAPSLVLCDPADEAGAALIAPAAGGGFELTVLADETIVLVSACATAEALMREVALRIEPPLDRDRLAA